ncbi:unannotated protein [freshwater metagenome]|uniref:Unannotated protein n=1 Tax=freshwater metagenome TaxID=449393 RepID=A0A6J6HWR5_9ZZZZ
MDVQIDRRSHDPQPRDSRLLDGFAECVRSEVGIAIDMTARLEPFLQLGVEKDDESIGSLFNHECGRGEMPIGTGSVQCVGMRVRKREHLVADAGLLPVDGCQILQMGDHEPEIG